MPLDDRAARDAIVSQYVTVSGLALLLYDHILTLSTEIELVWPAKMSPVKCAFLINRYLCPLVLAFICAVNSGHWRDLDDQLYVQDYVASVFLPGEILLLTFTILKLPKNIKDCLSSGTTLTSRRHIHRTAFWVLSACWMIHLVIDIALVTLFGVLDMTHARYLPEYNLCSIEKHHSWTVLLNSMVLHTILISLLLYIWISTPRNSKTRFTHLIVRDGCVWYIAMLVPMLLTLIMGVRARSSLAALLFYFIWATTSISLSRLLLSIKDAQGSEEWGQIVKLVVPDIELARQSEYQFNHSRELLRLNFDH
ncbi:unnamed protein product [Rhizoctonia solani]|uniref:DUF6533 domain-containing protein n=1 Tax=Rhizoctonia solani TaxID=456999 RepID=A0A8H3B576_9AGAM|nr:unnamed protein product [Rhizoctonia solani]